MKTLIGGLGLMGMMVLSGAGATANPALIAALEKRVLTRDHAAEYQLGKIYSESREPKEFTRAADLLRASANGGNTNAMIAIAEFLKSHPPMIVNGGGECLHWYCEAANRGNSEACLQAGYLLKTAYGTGSRTKAQREKEAFDYYSKGAALGNKTAVHFLADYYYNGIGVRKDEGVAAQLYERAEQYGGVAMVLSRTNPIETYKFAKVQSYKDGEVFHYLTESAARMSPAEIAQGDKLFVAYVKMHKIKPAGNRPPLFVIQ